MQNAIKKVKIPPQNNYLKCYAFALEWIKCIYFFTSEDIIEAYDIAVCDTPKEPRVWGAVIKELHKNNFIEHAGFSKYKKPCGHSKPINVWKSKIR